jgi:hypothetical protein
VKIIKEGKNISEKEVKEQKNHMSVGKKVKAKVGHNPPEKNQDQYPDKNQNLKR